METRVIGRGEGREAGASPRRFAVPRRRGYRSARSSLGLAAAIAASLLLLTLLAVGALLPESAGELPAGTRIGDVDVGGLGEADAGARLAARTAALAEQPVTFTLGERTWSARPAEIGVTYDADAAIARAMASGSEADSVGGFLRAARIASDPVAVPLAIRFDQAPFDRFLARLDAEIGPPPVDASVAVVGTDVSVTPAREGRGLDREAARAALVPLLGALRPASVALSERAVPAAIGDDQAAAMKTRLDLALAEPTVLIDGDWTWPIAADEVARLVRVAPIERDGTRTLDVTLDDAGVRALVERIAAGTNRSSADAWLEDRAGQTFLVPAIEGRTLREEELAAALRTAVLGGEHEIPLPVDRDPTGPSVTTDELLADLGITGLLAGGKSAFAGSDAGRDTNVRLAADRVDGALVPPGGTFSYNAAIGSLFDSGFVAANSMIEGFETAEGGGVCQVSTTIFRAALQAGLPITEWWPHGFRSPFYEQGGWSPGFDASIVQVWQQPESDTDLRFVNPTDAWMLVRVTVGAGSTLRVDLLGAPIGYGVSVDEPVVEVVAPAPPAVDEVDPELPPGTVVEDRPAADALEVTVVRRVYDADGDELSVDAFVSSYGAQAALRRVSPDLAEGA